MNKILAINIGSTSTKAGLFLDHDPLFKVSSQHSSEELSALHGYDEWLRFHQRIVNSMLAPHGKVLEGLALVVSRGGLTRPIDGGGYRINEKMLHDLRSGEYGRHPSNVGPAIASVTAAKYGVSAFVFDAPVTDELDPIARFSGLNGVERESAFHVLNQKSAARKAAQDLNIPYEQGHFIVAHLGGGITIGAHIRGRIVDGTHGLSEGPFTPQRTGALPLKQIIELCFSGRYSKDELFHTLFGQGGVYSYLGTHDIESVEERAAGGDQKSLFVLQAMGYQVAKEIAAMGAVLNGRVDAVVLTGNLCNARTVVEEIKNRVSFVGTVCIYPGEDELENLASGGLAILAMGGIAREY